MASPSSDAVAPPAAPRLMRVLFALACGVLAAASVASFRRESIERTGAEKFVRRFALDMRRPVEIGAMRYEPSADLATGIAVNASLSDATRVGGGERERGIDRAQEATIARDLMLDAAAKRPGWAYHRYLLGQLMYGLAKGEHDPASPAWQTWNVPLRLAAEGAPGLDAPSIALAQTYLQSWSKLSSSQRAEAIPVLRRALQVPGFLSTQFLVISDALSSEQATTLLPDDSEVLGSAAAAYAAHGDLAAAKNLIDRADAAEREERRDGIAKIEARFRMRDRDGLATACAEWAGRHPVAGLDDPAGRSQAGRVLELWPGDRGGPWDGDPRAELVRFFLDGRETAVPGATLSRTIGALSEVPDFVAARVKLLAGDVSGAQEIAAHPQDPGFPEWTAYYSDLARILLRQGRPREARGVLDLVAVASREDCDGLLVRRDVARSLKDSGELAIVSQRIEALRSSSRATEVLAGTGSISLCLDPEQPSARSIALRMASQVPSLVQFGWGMGRVGTVLLSGERVINVPADGLSGRRELTVRTIGGSPIRASISPAAGR
ncbi:MAG: hypothetical protein M3167_01475 [Acidobacteriota bacterium]|nr:hypothetical protein [Acidobacteriota bacterium]